MGISLGCHGLGLPVWRFRGCHERRVWCFKRSGVKILRAVVIQELIFLGGGEGDHGFPLMNRLSGMMKLEGLPKPVEALRVPP